MVNGSVSSSINVAVILRKCQTVFTDFWRFSIRQYSTVFISYIVYILYLYLFVIFTEIHLNLYIQRVWKGCRIIFYYNSRNFWWIFNFFANGNKNEYSTIAWWRQSWLWHVTSHESRQFNFSLPVEINHIEFGDKFLIKPMRM